MLDIPYVSFKADYSKSRLFNVDELKSGLFNKLFKFKLTPICWLNSRSFRGHIFNVDQLKSRLVTEGWLKKNSWYSIAMGITLLLLLLLLLGFWFKV